MPSDADCDGHRENDAHGGEKQSFGEIRPMDRRGRYSEPREDWVLESIWRWRPCATARAKSPNAERHVSAVAVSVEPTPTDEGVSLEKS